jgi:uncharacterized protein (TIGR03086 family)
MDEIIERFERIANGFTDRVRGVPAERWDDPSPCEGWSARDVVGHLTEWIPGFFGPLGVDFGSVPSVDDDPVAAWEAVRSALVRAMEDPALAAAPVQTPMGAHTLAETIDMIVTGDVFTHTWDLARATGQDEALDPEQLQRMVVGMGSIPDEVLRADGMFGPRVDVPADADDQTRLLAYLGRRA